MRVQIQHYDVPPTPEQFRTLVAIARSRGWTVVERGGPCDVVMVWSLTDLVPDKAMLIGFLSYGKCHIYSHAEGIDTTAPPGWNVFDEDVLAQFHRDCVKKAIAAARAEGRHPGGPKLAPERVGAILAGFDAGLGMQAICRVLDHSTATVQAIVKRHRPKRRKGVGQYDRQRSPRGPERAAELLALAIGRLVAAKARAGYFTM